MTRRRLVLLCVVATLSGCYEDSAAKSVNGDQTNDDASDSGAVYLFR